MKTLEEFRSDLKSLRDDMFNNSETMDLKLVASYLDRLVMYMEDLTETLQGMETELEVMCKCCEGGHEMAMPQMAKPQKAKPAAKKSKPKKAAKKKAKKRR